MTQSSRILLIAVSLLILGMTGPTTTLAKGPPIKVTEAIPAEADQGDKDLPVILKGKEFGFDPDVVFILNETGDPAPLNKMNPKNIQFNLATGNIEFLLDVALNADVGDYDIEVTVNGRKGKGTTLLKVNLVGGGNVDPTFDVTLSGDVSGYGTDWPVENSGIESISYFDGFQGHTGGVGFIDLSYFVVPNNLGGPFTGERGKNCFGDSFPIPLKAGSLEQRPDGSAYAHFTVYGYTDDGVNEMQYHLDMTGDIVDPYDWSPQATNTMILETWILYLGANKYKKYVNIACLGESTGEEDFQTEIYVERSN
jgi:hypothetical protein